MSFIRRLSKIINRANMALYGGTPQPRDIYACCRISGQNSDVLFSKEAYKVLSDFEMAVRELAIISMAMNGGQIDFLNQNQHIYFPQVYRLFTLTNSLDVSIIKCGIFSTSVSPYIGFITEEGAQYAIEVFSDTFKRYFYSGEAVRRGFKRKGEIVLDAKDSINVMPTPLSIAECCLLAGKDYDIMFSDKVKSLLSDFEISVRELTIIAAALNGGYISFWMDIPFFFPEVERAVASDLKTSGFNIKRYVIDENTNTAMISPELGYIDIGRAQYAINTFPDTFNRFYGIK